MPTLQLPLLDAKRMASALLPHVERGWAGTSLSSIAVGHEGAQFAVASDRYTCGRYDLTNVATIYPESLMLIPHDLLSVVLTIGPKTLPMEPTRYTVTIEAHERNYKTSPRVPKWEATLSIDYQVPETERTGPLPVTHFYRVFDAVDQTKTFPPVARLFDTWVPGEEVRNPVVLDPDHLAKFTGYAKRIRHHIRFSLPDKGTGGAKVGPVLVEIDPRFKGLLMPIAYMSGPANEFGTDLAAENAARIQAEKEAASTSQDTDSQAPDDAPSSGN